MAKLKLRVDEDEYLYPKTYTPTQYTMLGAYNTDYLKSLEYGKRDNI